MNLLITGAWQATSDELQVIRNLGHEIVILGQESQTLPCSYEWVEGIIGNGIFLYHPIEKFTSLRYIQLTSAGFDRVPLEYITDKNITIHNARGVYSIPMAEHVIACVLTLYRKLYDFQVNQQNHEWNKIRDIQELYGKKVLILGCGNVGSECAKRFNSFDCSVIGLDIFSSTTLANFEMVYNIAEIDTHLPHADIIVLTLPLNSETRHIMNKKRLSLLKDRAILCNIARGEHLVEEDLILELESGRISACLDVFNSEPLVTNSVLWTLPNVLLTPHNSFVGRGNAGRVFKVIKQNLQQSNNNK